MLLFCLRNAIAEEEVVEKVSPVEADALGGGEALQVGLGGGRSSMGVGGSWREGMSEMTGSYPL